MTHAVVYGYAVVGAVVVATAARNCWKGQPPMMEPVEVTPWVLLCDREATQKAYAAIDMGDPERCGCAMCLNWVASRDKAYPPEFVSLLDRLGIRPDREVEVAHTGRLGSGLHHYLGWFHFIGRIENEQETRRAELEMGAAEGRFSVQLSSEADPLPESFKGQPVVQLDFAAEIPWVVDLPQPE